MNIQLKKFPHAIFRAYDIRGKVENLNHTVIRSIACAFANLFRSHQQDHVVLGYDARLSSPYLAYVIEKTLKEHQIAVMNIGCCSTPQLYFMTQQQQGNGIMITASHNPKSDNGFKWLLQGESPSPEMIQQLGRCAEGYATEDCTTHDFLMQSYPMQHPLAAQCLHRYQDFILQDIHLKKSFKVVLDGLHGSAGMSAQSLLQQLGCEVIALRCLPNGHFPDHAPDPSQASHLRHLQQKILLHRADVGIALDGDGDRVVMLDEQGRILSADRLLALMSCICLEQHPQHEVVFDVKCSNMIGQVVQKYAATATMIRTGSTFLRKYIAHSKGKAVFGGEYAGHYVFNDGRGLGYDDGIYAALRVLEYWSQFSCNFSTLMAAYPERYATEDTYIATQGIAPQLVLQDFLREAQRFDAKLSTIDGVRLDFAHGFGIIRASNTGDFFTVRFDADSPAQLAEIRTCFSDLVKTNYPKLAAEILNAH
ncbi:phosphomannomutase/phosphoglucomutase [Acinetobacter larvae]|uniref:phosphomannomutase n=1 Tax=Acinetobacter larvae TaxID=1789224 RepID=A0A1B2M245_9GAMM|nr:phosphomannomutase/phosphoglucomutase [Acinetobacter larvae]AOA59093.1 phosphomannomutase [Acinetobacter larvae]